jgi:tetratricopeptide (TPR) repeat protein
MSNGYAMPFHNNKTQKPVKDQDLKTVTYFLRVAGLTVPFVCLLGLYLGYVYWGMSGAVAGVLIAAIAGLIISTIVIFLMDAVSCAAGDLLTGRREAVWTIREQVQGLLSQARFNKENKDYPAALSFVNKVLEKDPDFADALFLKAQILWEGFGHSRAAIQFLEKVLSLDSENKMVQNHALLLHNDLNTLESSPENMAIPQGIDIGLRSRKSSITQKLTHESFQDLKARAEETPMAWWAIYVAVIFGLSLICVLVSMNHQVQNLDRANTLMRQTIESAMKTTQAQALKIQKVEKSVQTMTSELSRINNKLNKKK